MTTSPADWPDFTIQPARMAGREVDAFTATLGAFASHTAVYLANQVDDVVMVTVDPQSSFAVAISADIPGAGVDPYPRQLVQVGGNDRMFAVTQHRGAGITIELVSLAGAGTSSPVVVSSFNGADALDLVPSAIAPVFSIVNEGGDAILPIANAGNYERCALEVSADQDFKVFARRAGIGAAGASSLAVLDEELGTGSAGDQVAYDVTIGAGGFAVVVSNQTATPMNGDVLARCTRAAGP